jgi:hypothetical protein
MLAERRSLSLGRAFFMIIRKDLVQKFQVAGIWRSFVDATVMPTSSFRKRSAGRVHEVIRRNRRAGEWCLRDPDRELQRDASVGDSADGKQL